MSVGLTGIALMLSTGKVGAVGDSRTPGGGQRITYSAPGGAQSLAELAADHAHVEVSPPPEAGTLGDARVMACVRARLSADGLISSILPASNDRGEDGVLQIGGDRVTVQVVTAKPEADFWKRVANGGAAATAALVEATAWIDSAVAAKARQYPAASKASMLLAVDVAHMGVLASSVVGSRYLQSHGDPVAKHGLGAVWLVGPTEENIFRLGRGRWESSEHAPGARSQEC